MTTTLFTVIMTFLVSNALMIGLYAACKSIRVVSRVGPHVLIGLCLLCVLRICLPFEFSWTREITIPALYNPVFNVLSYRIPYLGFSVTQILFAVWFSVSAFLLIRFVWKYRRHVKFVSRLPLFNADAIHSAATSITPGVKLDRLKLVSALPEDVPNIVGIFHPVILIPLRDYPEKELALILLHEYTHYIKRDNLTKFIVSCLAYLFWWCPGIHFFRRGLSAALEIRCDLQVTANMDKSGVHFYLNTIINAAESVSKTKLEIEGSRLAEGHDLLQRIEVLSRYQGAKPGIAARLLCVLFAVLLILASYLFVFQSDYDAPLEGITLHPNSEDIQMFDNDDGTYTVIINGEENILTEDDFIEFEKNLLN